MAVLILVQLAFQCVAHSLALEGRRLGVSYAFRKPGKTDTLALLYPTVAGNVSGFSLVPDLTRHLTYCQLNPLRSANVGNFSPLLHMKR